MVGVRALLLILCLLAGCKSAELPEEFRPLQRISEGNPFGKHLVTTLGTTVYVGDDLDPYVMEPMGARYRAILLHERVHSERQGEHFWEWIPWVLHYLVDQDFAWKEEQLGWYAEIKELQRLGQAVIPEHIAQKLSNYDPKIVGYTEARMWVLDVLAGRWKP